MSLKNNLDHVLRHATTTNSAASLHTPQPKASTTLPSFSTPGFRKPRASGSGSHSSSFHEIINISSDSISPGIKRSSSDSYFLSDSQPSSKRLKAEKENLFHPDHVNAKGKEKTRAESCDSSVNDDRSWNRVKTCLPPEFNAEYPDLLSKSIEELNDILLSNHEYNRQNMEAIYNYHSGKANKEDIYTLETIKSLLNSRISAIKRVLQYRENDPPGVHVSASTAPSVSLNSDGHQIPSHFTPHSPISAPIVASTSRLYEATSYSTASTLREGSIVNTQDSSVISIRERNPDSFASIPGSPEEDDDLWADLDIVTMEDLDTSPPAAPGPPQELTGPYAEEIDIKLKQVFKLQTFRCNQFEAISAAMAGRDVFVLMPTGGGKSLCYQLPAVCRGGKTKGVTVVVSPLLALMHDQVNGLRNNEVDAVLLTSATREGEAREIRERLYSKSTPTLLYVTPERLKMSSSLNTILRHLYRTKELARFVIDEAHCISTWGQDFREAYQELHTLRDDFPEVPIMALTATADHKTIDDILVRLQLNNPAVFTQSFNRANLFYSVVPKGSVDELVSFIKECHPNETGVIYRTGRDKCEVLADKLRGKNLQARHYHARMTPEEKEMVQAQWKDGECHILVATIAFGMGIDKKNVRFVIHYDLPKNMDGYYQETGRAGRDGLPADCILYYSYRDVQPLLTMIRDNKDGNTTKASIERQEHALNAVVRYCENNTVCRRTQILQHFGEKFDEKDCGEKCNNCVDKGLRIFQDVTQEAKKLVSLVKSFGHENVTMGHCRQILKGSNTAAVREKGHDQHPAFGAGRHLPNQVFDLLFDNCLRLDVLVEKSIQKGNWHHHYLKLGPKADELLQGRRKLQLDYRPNTSKPGSKARAKKRSCQVAPPAQEPERQQPLYADDDPMDDIEFSPKKINPRPPSVQVVDVISDSDNEAPRTGSRSRPLEPETLYHRLVAHRQLILDADHSLTKEQVLDDETLQYISAAPPQDFLSFKQILQDNSQEISGTTLDEAKKDANDRYSKYGNGFLQLCQGRMADPMLREKYAFRPASASTPKGPDNLRKFKFKPATARDS
ncbi:DNA helicase [Mycena pura]|uniref:DNA 3'-5' helicase n=1 Tax=Mycena pura TaxID=153505 RepID=A0AAD6UXB5_9AGAR|nr:DNA helicase [Mycena pura]